MSGGGGGDRGHSTFVIRGDTLPPNYTILNILGVSTTQNFCHPWPFRALGPQGPKIYYSKGIFSQLEGAFCGRLLDYRKKARGKEVSIPWWIADAKVQIFRAKWWWWWWWVGVTTNKSSLSFGRTQAGIWFCFLGEIGNLKYEKVTRIYIKNLYFFRIQFRYGDEEGKKVYFHWMCYFSKFYSNF